MFFSIIVPVYKTESEFLTRAITSICNQTWKNWECIVVDDNPKGSYYKQIVRDLEKKFYDEKRVHFIFHEDNMGANSARNTGIHQSIYDWLAFLDADDEWESHYLQKISDSFNDGLQCILISTAYYVMTRNRKILIKADHPNGNYFNTEIYSDIVSCTSGVIVEKRSLLAVGGFDAALPARQDYDTWIRLSRIGNFSFINIPLVYVYRDGHDSISTKYMNHVNGTLMVLHKILQYDLSEKQKNLVRMEQYLHIAEYCLNYNAFELARLYASKSSEYGDSPKIKHIYWICKFSYIYIFIKALLRKIALIFKIIRNQTRNSL